MHINSIELSHLVWEVHFVWFSLIITTLLLEMNFTRGHDSSSDLVAIPFLLLFKSNDVKGRVSVFQLLIVINRCNSSLSLRDIGVVIDIVRQATFFLHIRNK